MAPNQCPEDLEAVAARMAHSLGISLYINEGRIHQIGPGERIDDSRFTIAAARSPGAALR
jgi:hypothetical protein